MMPASKFWLLYFTVCLGGAPSDTHPDSNSDKTFNLVNEMRTWTDAKSHCEQSYTDLAVIYNQGDWQRVLAAVGSSTSEVWIGLHRDPEWKWSNGEDFMYFNWDAGWGTTSGFPCAYSFSGKWQTADCGGSFTYMCQKVMNTSGIFIKTYEYSKSVPATWDNARNSCLSENGELASITNKQDQHEFDKIAPSGTNIWIGLKRVNDVWKWSSEEPFQNWATNDFSSTKNCVKLSGDKKWTPEDCSDKHMFLCYTVTPSFTTQPTSCTETTTVTQPTSSASSGTTVSNTPSYNLTYIDDPKTWIEALQHCWNHHKTLVHIVNSTVQEYVTQMLQDKIYPNGVWIGLERNILFPCATWMWTGGPYVNYSEWHSSFPVDPISQYCGKLVGNGSKWLDSYCSEELPFICQD